MSSLTEIAAGHRLGGAAAKPQEIYEIYRHYFPPPDAPITLLELGVYKGDSLRVLASYFRSGKIIGVDLATQGPDFSGFANIAYESTDQADCARLEEISATHAPSGYDIIIDDASHYGHLSQISYSALFPRLKPGGLYIVEDWGTGYYDDWPDGRHYQTEIAEPADGGLPKRIPSHDFGMVGFVKSLIDDAAGDHLRPSVHGPKTRTDTLAFMHVYKTCVILKKIG
jgi:hypothetical protein